MSFEIEYGKSHTIKGTLQLVKSVQPNAQSLYKTSSHLSQDSKLNNSFNLAVLLGAVVPHLERGSAALRAALLHLSNRWEAGGYLYFSLSSITALSSSPMVQIDENQQVFISSLLHWCTLNSQAFPLISPSILERKRCQTRLESRSTDFQTLKST